MRQHRPGKGLGILDHRVVNLSLDGSHLKIAKTASVEPLKDRHLHECLLGGEGI